jgi:hypothetical protein
MNNKFDVEDTAKVMIYNTDTNKVVAEHEVFNVCTHMHYVEPVCEAQDSYKELKALGTYMGRHVSITLTDVEFEKDTETLRRKPLEFVGTGYNFPRGNKFPKKKRIKKKWMKKYITVYKVNNVQLYL